MPEKNEKEEEEKDTTLWSPSVYWSYTEVPWKQHFDSR